MSYFLKSLILNSHVWATILNSRVERGMFLFSALVCGVIMLCPYTFKGNRDLNKSIQSFRLVLGICMEDS